MKAIHIFIIQTFKGFADLYQIYQIQLKIVFIF